MLKVATQKVLGAILNIANSAAGQCPDPKCSSKVTEMYDDIKDLKQDLRNDVFPVIHNNSKALSRIEGYIEALKNGKGQSM